MSLPPRVLVTRSAQQGSELADRLRALGLEPILIPAIETVEPISFAALDVALAQLNTFHWLLFTSANAVEAFATRVLYLRGSLIAAKVGSSPPKLQIAAIGPATARSLKNLGLTPDLVPLQAVAESLAESLLPHTRQPDGSPTRFLLVRAEEAREHLPETFREAGAEVTVAPAYRTVVPEASVSLLRELLANHRVRQLDDSLITPNIDGVPPPTIQAVTFTSSSTARNLLALCEAAGVTLPPEALRISIGPITSQTLRDLGMPPYAEAPEATVASLAQAVVEALRAVR